LSSVLGQTHCSLPELCLHLSNSTFFDNRAHAIRAVSNSPFTHKPSSSRYVLKNWGVGAKAL
jgi:hypothetical protein